MPRIDTPTLADHRGVEPICTRTPMCPLHTKSLQTSFEAHRQVALLISTPAYCQVAICGPVLDVVMSLQGEFGRDVDFIHAEVYASGEQASRDSAHARLSPTVEALHLTFEPCLLLSHTDGTVARRLDTIFDRAEVRALFEGLQ